jgi:hypothetical protein
VGADPAVEAELDRLPAMPVVALRKRYRELFRTDPPQAFGPDLLRRSIAQMIQEKAYGGLPPKQPFDCWRTHSRLLRKTVPHPPRTQADRSRYQAPEFCLQR